MIEAMLAAALSMEPNSPRTYAAGESVPVRFTLDERSPRGGRSTPFYSSYRAWITEDRRRSDQTCQFYVPDSEGVKPGETRAVSMVCRFAVREGQTLDFFELGRPVGRAVVETTSD